MGSHNWLKCQPCFLIRGDHWIAESGNCLAAYKGMGT